MTVAPIPVVPLHPVVLPVVFTVRSVLYHQVTPVGAVFVVVQLHQGDDAFSLAARFGVALVRHGHKLVPSAFDDRPGSRQPIVEVARLDDLHHVSDVGAYRAPARKGNHAEFQRHIPPSRRISCLEGGGHPLP